GLRRGRRRDERRTEGLVRPGVRRAGAHRHLRRGHRCGGRERWEAVEGGVMAGTLSALTSLSAGLREFYEAPYRRTMARARRDEDDLFTLVVLAEALGV